MRPRTERGIYLAVALGIVVAFWFIIGFFISMAAASDHHDKRFKLKGWVYTPTGKPIRNVTVTLEDDCPGWPKVPCHTYTVTTNENGKFQVREMPWGEYHVYTDRGAVTPDTVFIESDSRIVFTLTARTR